MSDETTTMSPTADPVAAADPVPAVDPVPAAPTAEPAHKLVCPRHGEIATPIVLPHSQKEFCPLCVESFFERESVHLLERVHVIDNPELRPED
jgi:hypothetical protein